MSCGTMLAIGKEPGCSLLIGVLDALPIQALRHIDRSLGLPTVQDGKCFVAELALLGVRRHCGRLAVGKKLWALGKAGRVT